MFTVHLQRFEPESFDRLRYIKSPADGAARWLAGAQGAEDAWNQGLQTTTKDIVGNAIRQKDVAVRNFADALNSGRWANGLTKVGNGGIKSAAAKKKQNYGTGIAAGLDAYTAAAQKLYPYIAAGQNQIESMPSGTIAASKARASAWIDYMHAGKGQF